MLCDKNNNSDKYHFEAEKYGYEDGTYELCGEKINGNPEKIKGHMLIRHGAHKLRLTNFNYTNAFEILKSYLTIVDVEGIVFHHKSDDRMCKIRKSDFGIKR